MKKSQPILMLTGLFAVFLLFDRTAAHLGSNRGQWGVTVGLMVVAAVLAIEMAVFRETIVKAAKRVGLLKPDFRGIAIGIFISMLLLCIVPVFGHTASVAFNFYPGWYWLLPGLFFQAGIAEETLFRGFLFGHFRERHNFWPAAAISAIPFTIVHLILFFTIAWPIALASVLLAVVTSFPFSRLYELGGRTMWAPAILHFAVQSGVKIFIPVEGTGQIFPLVWIAACAVIPLIVFVFPLRVNENAAR